MLDRRIAIRNKVQSTKDTEFARTCRGSFWSAVLPLCGKRTLNVFSVLGQVRDDPPAKKRVTPEEEEKMRQLLRFEEAPEFLQYNPYILRGYRSCLTTKLCLERLAHLNPELLKNCRQHLEDINRTRASTTAFTRRRFPHKNVIRVTVYSGGRTRR